MAGFYIYKMANRLQTQSIKSLEVRANAGEYCDDYVQTRRPKTVWVAPCRSWYKRSTTDRQVIAVYGGSCYLFIDALREPTLKDYKLEHFKGRGRNRFSWLGKGLRRKGGRVGIRRRWILRNTLIRWLFRRYTINETGEASVDIFVNM